MVLWVKAAMANKRLGSLLSHLSPPVREAGLSELGHLYECERPKSDREAKLLENLMLSRLRSFKTCDAELQFVPCRSNSKSLEVETSESEDWDSLEAPPSLATPTLEEEDEDGAVFDGEVVRSGITSASALSTSGGHVTLPKSKSFSLIRMAGCEFCDIIHGIAPCFKLYEDELCLAILDINPLSIGHSLILPKSHFSCLEATPPQVAAAMCAMVPPISRALLAATRCDSFNMLVNSGVAAGQVIMHTHFHIIPRCKDDGLWKSETATRKPLRKVQEAKLLAQAVRSKLSFTI